MERKITKELMRWKSDPNHLPLIVTGCRQIGKTYSIKEFVSREYESHIYINFETQAEKKDLFKGDRSAEELIPRIILSEGVRMHAGKSAIVLDEIQDCPEAYSALKPLSEDRRYDIICSGSFLGLNPDGSDRLSPLGYVDVMEMHPMDFEEYLWAMGVGKELIAQVRANVQNLERIDDYFHRIFTKYFREYMVVGGMPASVKTYMETRDYVLTYTVLRSIIGMLRKDTVKYSSKAGRVKIDKCLDSIPRQLSRENKKFIYSDIEKKKGVGKRTYRDALEWMEEAGMVSLCYNLTEPSEPLCGNVIEDSFKVFMNDTGLLMALMNADDSADVALRDPYSNNGAVMECAVASALTKNGYPLYYYSKPNSSLMIDLITKFEGIPALIEVKSGRNRKAKSLSTLMSEKDRTHRGYRIMDSNIETDGQGIIRLPLYAPCFFEEVRVSNIPEPPSAEEVNEVFHRRSQGA